MHTQLNVFRALDPSIGYPFFDFKLAVNGTRYDLVLSSEIADTLRAFCLRDGHKRIDGLLAGRSSQIVRTYLVQMIIRDPDQKKLVYTEVEEEAEAAVFEDGLREAATFSYLFVSAGIARALAYGKEGSRLPAEFATYVQRHRRALTECGGFELLTAHFDAHEFGWNKEVIEPIAVSVASEAETQRRRHVLLRDLL